MSTSQSAKKEVYVFDSAVPDIQLLLDVLGPDPVVIVLEPDRDGVLQLAEALAGVSDIDAFHIFSHGSEGMLYLGATTLSSENIAPYQTQLAEIGKSLTESGHILLYGCNVGSGDAGMAFVQQLSAFTGAEVAVSRNLTGAAALGGYWVIEAAPRAIKLFYLGVCNISQGWTMPIQYWKQAMSQLMLN